MVLHDKWSFKPSATLTSLIHSPIHRFLHQLLTFSINQMKVGDRVRELDLLLFWCILNPGIVCNIPYHIAFFIYEKAAKVKLGAPVFGWHLITLLAQSYGVMEPLLAMMFTIIEGCLLQPRSFLDAMIVVEIGGGKYKTPLDDPIRMIKDVRPQEIENV